MNSIYIARFARSAAAWGLAFDIREGLAVTSLLSVLSFISVIFILAIQSQISASYMSLIQIDNKSDRNFWQQKQQLL